MTNWITTYIQPTKTYETDNRITQSGDLRITQSGDQRILTMLIKKTWNNITRLYHTIWQ